jgi:type II secretory pathway pseudopilin PulG
MNRRWNNFFAARRGTTLVEVVAALVILGTILAAMLIARGRFVQQDVQARRKIEASRALDALVNGWMNGPASAIPVQATGSLPDAPGQTWSTRLLRDPSAEEIGARVLRVDVFDRSERQPIVTLDLLIHPEQSNGT